MASKKKRKIVKADLDMTPMIDVVFQLMIFFLVTLKIDDSKNEDIQLVSAPHGPRNKDNPGVIVIEVDKHGRISIAGTFISTSKLKSLLRAKYDRNGVFPVLIRADGRAKHAYVRKVMDACTESGLYKLNFMAIKKKAGT